MISIYEPDIIQYNKSAINAIESGWISNHGEYVEKSTQKIKEILNCKFAILMANGTCATHCLFLSLKFKHPEITKIYVPNNEFGERVKNSNQVWSGFILLRKSFNPIRFIGEWLTYVQDQRAVTDSPSIFGPENASFRDHRHDQSILSLLCKKWGIFLHEMNKNNMIDIRNPV
jgi:hypothetical protein